MRNPFLPGVPKEIEIPLTAPLEDRHLEGKKDRRTLAGLEARKEDFVEVAMVGEAQRREDLVGIVVDASKSGFVECKSE